MVANYSLNKKIMTRYAAEQARLFGGNGGGVTNPSSSNSKFGQRKFSLSPPKHESEGDGHLDNTLNYQTMQANHQ
jgi:hypothetical protein